MIAKPNKPMNKRKRDQEASNAFKTVYFMKIRCRSAKGLAKAKKQWQDHIAQHPGATEHPNAPRKAVYFMRVKCRTLARLEKAKDQWRVHKAEHPGATEHPNAPPKSKSRKRRRKSRSDSNQAKRDEWSAKMTRLFASEPVRAIMSSGNSAQRAAKFLELYPPALDSRVAVLELADLQLSPAKAGDVKEAAAFLSRSRIEDANVCMVDTEFSPLEKGERGTIAQRIFEAGVVGFDALVDAPAMIDIKTIDFDFGDPAPLSPPQWCAIDVVLQRLYNANTTMYAWGVPELKLLREKRDTLSPGSTSVVYDAMRVVNIAWFDGLKENRYGLKDWSWSMGFLAKVFDINAHYKHTAVSDCKDTIAVMKLLRSALRAHFAKE